GFYDDELALYRRSEETARKEPGGGGDVAEYGRMAIARLEDREDEFKANDEESARLAKEVAEKNKRIEEANAERKKKNERPMKLLPEPVSDRSAFGDALIACEHALSVKQQALGDPEFNAALTELR